MTVVIDCKKLRSERAMHDELHRRFDFAPHYGRNLDALWDMLSEFSGERTIVLKNPERANGEVLARLLPLLFDLCRSFASNRLDIYSDAAVVGREYESAEGVRYTVLALACDRAALCINVVYRESASGMAWLCPLAEWGDKGGQTGRLASIE